MFSPKSFIVSQRPEPVFAVARDREKLNVTTHTAMVDLEKVRQDTSGAARVMRLNNCGAALPLEAVVGAVIQHLKLEREVGSYAAAAVAGRLCGVEEPTTGLRYPNTSTRRSRLRQCINLKSGASLIPLAFSVSGPRKLHNATE
jgi:hypothetical protein